ncbi:Ig-like domain-containing protein [Anaerosporobacter sp.]|uniref:Ig-like domain-containing protein n=1 Tax=Anaerosporobacter sp. TaxID=1872529 RepID=UPI00286F03DD|nr:Ig-like domain-containing protein [Anaerosporobacter sp.]
MKWMKNLLCVCMAVLLVGALAISTGAVAKAEELEITHSTDRTTITLDGENVTSIVPEIYQSPKTKLTEYDVTLLGGKQANIRIPVQIDEPGYLFFEIYATNVSDMVTTRIKDSANQEINYCIGSFVDATGEEKQIAACISKPGTYYYEFSVTSSFSMNENLQEMTAKFGFVPAKDLNLLTGKTIVVPGMDKVAYYHKVKVEKDGILKIEMGNYKGRWNTIVSGGELLLCNSSKKVISRATIDGEKTDKITWNVTKGTYYICTTLHEGTYDFKGEFLAYLKTPTIKGATVNSTKITGVVAPNATVTVKVGSKSYKATADGKGNYKVTVKKLKKATEITVNSKNSKGQISKEKSVVVK